MGELHWGTDTVLLALLAALTWFVRSVMEKNDVKHAEHFEHAKSRDLHETAQIRQERAILTAAQLDAHAKLDDQRFDALTDTMRDMKLDLKEILLTIRNNRQ